ncbi:MAG TPA: phosphoribosyltransferase, partial [Stackebrandtia sp.]|uniref:phosphoribosyltransferase n=1 Tax=Stackebrandtia sp. TaxID=2023065 RepID=UPI002D406568
ALPNLAVAELLRARPAPDSSDLNRQQRREAAARRWRLRPGRVAAVATDRHVIVVDDIVTTGATLASVTSLLTAAGLPVSGGVVLAATLRRHRRDTQKSSRFRW